LAKAEKNLDVVLVSDGTPEEHAEFLASAGVGAEINYLDAREVGIAYQVGTTPYGVLVDDDGTLVAKGLCNNMSHVESLLNALETATPDGPAPLLRPGFRQLHGPRRRITGPST
jgi:methylamine dehydrogenase accessory protein MauD